MSLAIETIDGVLVLLPQGQINSANAPNFEADAMAQLERGAPKVVLDLSQLDYISSAGLRVVLLLAKKLRQLGGALVMCNISPNVREVFEISGFLSILSVSETRAEALAQLAQP